MNNLNIIFSYLTTKPIFNILLIFSISLSCQFSKDEIGKTSHEIKLGKKMCSVDKDPKLHERPCLNKSL